MAENTDEESEDEPSLTQEQMDDLNRELLESSFVTSDVLYIELRLLRDYKLGAILRHVMDTKAEDIAKTTYETIQKHIATYAHRKYDDVDHYIPGLPITNDEVDRLLASTENSDPILNASPMTEFVHTLIANLMINANHSEVQNKSGQIRFLVNTYPLDISAREQRLVSLYITRLCAVDVEIFCQDPETLDKTMIDRCDEFYSFYIDRLMRNTYFYDKLKKLSFLRRRLYVPKYFGFTYTKDHDTFQDQTYTHAVLNTMITFEYIPMTYVSPPIPKEKQPSANEEAASS